MDARLSGDFWSDPEIEALTPEQRMAALWCITSSRTTLFGFVEVTKKRFEFETGTPYEALEELTKAHSKGFKKCGIGVWVRRFIAHQFGTGNKLVRNNFAKGLVDELRAYKGLPVFAEVLTEYPELRELYDHRFHEDSEDLLKGLASPRIGKEEKVGKEGDQEPHETPPPDPTRHPLLDRVCALFRMRSSTPLDASQTRSWENKKNRAAVAATPEEDWLILEWWYRFDGKDSQFRRKDLATLLNNFNAEIQRARFSAGQNGYSPVAPKKEKAPGNWKELLAAADPEMHIPETFEQLPESLRKWVIELAKKEKEGPDHE